MWNGCLEGSGEVSEQPGKELSSKLDRSVQQCGGLRAQTRLWPFEFLLASVRHISSAVVHRPSIGL